jgi:hypothetical protein
MLSGASVTFEWDECSGTAQSFRLSIGKNTHGDTTYGFYEGPNRSHQVSGLPTDGCDVLVRLETKVVGQWRTPPVDYNYVAYYDLATMISPAPGSTLASTAVQFTWDTGAGMTNYCLSAGGCPDSSCPDGTKYDDYFKVFLWPDTSYTSQGELPSDGSTVWVRLYSYFNPSTTCITGEWLYPKINNKPYEYTAYTGWPNPPTLVSPTNGEANIPVSPPPDLVVNVTDPQEDSMTVTFFGREQGVGEFAQIGQQTNVASGSNASVAWDHIAADKTCEWYAEAVDVGPTIRKSNTWTFTTEESYTGDFDKDLDVDQEDFGHLQACFSGANRPYESGCEDADLDVDSDVDLEDFGEFQACMGGANQPPGCL